MVERARMIVSSQTDAIMACHLERSHWRPMAAADWRGGGEAVYNGDRRQNGPGTIVVVLDYKNSIFVSVKRNCRY